MYDARVYGYTCIWKCIYIYTHIHDDKYIHILDTYTTSIYLYMCYLYDWSLVYTVHANLTCIVNAIHTNTIEHIYTYIS